MSKRNAVSFIVETMEIPGKPGAIQFVNREGIVCGLNHCCPCGCGKWSFIRMNPDAWAPGTLPMWKCCDPGTDDGLYMTLTPSIGIKPQDAAGAYHWHGYLKNGVFEEC